MPAAAGEARATDTPARPVCHDCAILAPRRRQFRLDRAIDIGKVAPVERT